MSYEDEDSGNSFPFIDDLDDEDDEYDDGRSRYSVNIIERYCNKNRRNTEVKNCKSRADKIAGKSLGPVAPLAEKTETKNKMVNINNKNNSSNVCSNSNNHRHHHHHYHHPPPPPPPPPPPSQQCREKDTVTNACSIKRSLPKDSVMKLVIKGWNSTISIQDLDHKSSITLKRKGEQRGGGGGHAGSKPKFVEGGHECGDGPKEKFKRKRWKMLTRSLMAKSSKLQDRRSLDERYPKYVLLKNEDDEHVSTRKGKCNPKDSYPKMIVLNDNKAKTGETKSGKRGPEKFEFSLKKSFKNKTNPTKSDEVVGGGDASARRPKSSQNTKGVKPSTSRSQLKQTSCNSARQSSQAQVFTEIEGVLNDALKLYPDEGDVPEMDSHGCGDDGSAMAPGHFCNVPDHNGHLCQPLPPMFIPVYDTYGRVKSLSKQSQTNESELCLVARSQGGEKDESDGKDLDLRNLQFGLLSTFFPSSVVIMNTFEDEDYLAEENDATEKDEQRTEFRETEVVDADEDLSAENLNVPVPDLTIKSKMMTEGDRFECPQIVTDNSTEVSSAPADASRSDDCDDRSKTDDTETTTTKYFCFDEKEQADNESTTTTCTLKTDQPGDNRGNTEDPNLSLTKVGYDMYDKLTRLSLRRDDDDNDDVVPEKLERDEARHPTPCRITFESNEKIIKISLLPDEKLNFEILDPGPGPGCGAGGPGSGPGLAIQMPGTSDGKTAERDEDVKVAKRNELWWSSEGGTQSSDVVPRTGDTNENDAKARKDYSNIQLSLANNKNVYLTIDRDERDKNRQRQTGGKLMKEVNVGTDDIGLAGGDCVRRSGENFKNLSPRKGQLLRNLQEKLEIGESKINYLSGKMNKRLGNEKLDVATASAGFPGIFLVQQIGPSSEAVKTSTTEVCRTEKPSKPVPRSKSPVQAGPLREYYCEECLATMRIFEDENPSVKRMVDKFETIIQLKNY